MGFGVWGLGFGVWGLGFRGMAACTLGSDEEVWDCWFHVQLLGTLGKSKSSDPLNPKP